MVCPRIAPFVVLLCAMLSFGQSAHEDATPDPSRRKPSPTISIDVDLVLLNTTVTDPGNKLVTGLGKESFQVWEDKIQQEIEYFSSENLPLSVGIIFDVSGSMEKNLTPARTAANTFMRMGDRDDEYFLIVFSDSPQLEETFTTDITKLQNRLLLTHAKGSTSLYDALYLGLEQASRGSSSRKALLLITDGLDNHSRYSFSNVKDFAREHDVQIYAHRHCGRIEPARRGIPGPRRTRGSCKFDGRTCVLSFFCLRP